LSFLSNIKVSKESVGKVLRRSLEVLREEGFKSFIFKVLGETFYRRLILVERSFNDPLPDTSPIPGVSIRMLSREDVSEYLKFRPDSNLSEIEGRLRIGQLCFAAFLGGQIVHAAWVTSGRAFVAYLGIEIELFPGEFYLFDIYTSPKFRGMNFYSYREMEMQKELRGRGCRRIIALIYPENRPAMKGIKKLGYLNSGKIGYIKIGPFRHDFQLREDSSIEPVNFS